MGLPTLVTRCDNISEGPTGDGALALVEILALEKSAAVAP
jgi:hypothetical protein